MAASLSAAALDALLQRVKEQSGKPLVAVVLCWAGAGGATGDGGLRHVDRHGVARAAGQRRRQQASIGGDHPPRTHPQRALAGRRLRHGQRARAQATPTSDVHVLVLTAEQAPRVVLTEYAGQFTLVLDVSPFSVGGDAVACGHTTGGHGDGGACPPLGHRARCGRAGRGDADDSTGHAADEGSRPYAARRSGLARDAEC